MNDIKKIKDIEKLCGIEKSIIVKGKPLDESNSLMLSVLEEMMQDYTYGWYICEESFIEQLKSINKFKIYILDKSE